MLYRVLSNLKNNGRTYTRREKIELDEDIADTLVEDGVLQRIKQVEPEPEPKPEVKLEPKAKEESNEK